MNQVKNTNKIKTVPFSLPLCNSHSGLRQAIKGELETIRRAVSKEEGLWVWIKLHQIERARVNTGTETTWSLHVIT